MDTYSLLRQLADSWVLLAMFVFFLGCGVWAFWPSQRSAREDASMIPFRDHQCERLKACQTHTSDQDFPKEPQND